MKSLPAAGLLRPLAAALAVSLAALAGCNSKGAAPAAAPAAVPARVLEVQPRSVPIVVEGVGQVEGSKEVEVRAKVSGTLKKIVYKEGEVVAPGVTSTSMALPEKRRALAVAASARSVKVQSGARAEANLRQSHRW